jgi:hypothetical protein
MEGGCRSQPTDWFAGRGREPTNSHCATSGTSDGRPWSWPVGAFRRRTDHPRESFGSRGDGRTGLQETTLRRSRAIRALRTAHPTVATREVATVEGSRVDRRRSDEGACHGRGGQPLRFAANDRSGSELRAPGPYRASLRGGACATPTRARDAAEAAGLVVTPGTCRRENPTPAPTRGATMRSSGAPGWQHRGEADSAGRARGRRLTASLVSPVPLRAVPPVRSANPNSTASCRRCGAGGVAGGPPAPPWNVRRPRGDTGEATSSEPTEVTVPQPARHRPDHRGIIWYARGPRGRGGSTPGSWAGGSLREVCAVSARPSGPRSPSVGDDRSLRSCGIIPVATPDGS